MSANTDFLQSRKLSWKAKGILTFLLSAHGQTKLRTISKEGEDSLRAGLMELRREGYVTMKQSRSGFSGRMQGTVWTATDRHMNDARVTRLAL